MAKKGQRMRGKMLGLALLDEGAILPKRIFIFVCVFISRIQSCEVAESKIYARTSCASGTLDGRSVK